MSIVRRIFRYLDALEAGQQIAIVFWLLLIDGVTFQLLWPWLIWIFSPYPDALWGIAAPQEKYVKDWFFHFSHWSIIAACIIGSGFAFYQEMKFSRWLSIGVSIWLIFKVIGVWFMAYALIIGVFNDGCPTYQYMAEDDEGYRTVCVSRGSDIGRDVRQRTDGELEGWIGDQ